MKKILFVFFVFLLLGTSLAKAQVGKTAVPFLMIAPDSRSTGMGNTGVALADNPSAVFWNPAGLAFQKQTQASLTHAQWLANFNADLFYDYLVGSYHVDGMGTFGAHITYLNLGEQIRTTGPPPYHNPPHFSSYEFALGLSYGFKLNENWALGTGFRYIHSSLFEGTVGGQNVAPASSFGVDVAALYKSDHFKSIFAGSDAYFSAGINVSNIGPSLNYTEKGEEDPIPTILRFGWAFTTGLGRNGHHTITIANDFSKLMVRADKKAGPVEALFTSWGSLQRQTVRGTSVHLSTLEQFMIGVGVEYWYNNLFSLRTGYYYEDPYNGNREFLTLGAGIHYKIIGVNFSYIYAMEEQHPLANTTRFGLILEL